MDQTHDGARQSVGIVLGVACETGETFEVNRTAQFAGPCHVLGTEAVHEGVFGEAVGLRARRGRSRNGFRATEQASDRVGVELSSRRSCEGRRASKAERLPPRRTSSEVERPRDCRPAQSDAAQQFASVTLFVI